MTNAIINHDAAKVLPNRKLLIIRIIPNMRPDSNQECRESVTGKRTMNQNRYRRKFRFVNLLSNKICLLHACCFILLKKKKADMMKNSGTAVLKIGTRREGNGLVCSKTIKMERINFNKSYLSPPLSK